MNAFRKLLITFGLFLLSVPTLYAQPDTFETNVRRMSGARTFPQSEHSIELYRDWFGNAAIGFDLYPPILRLRWESWGEKLIFAPINESFDLWGYDEENRGEEKIMSKQNFGVGYKF